MDEDRWWEYDDEYFFMCNHCQGIIRNDLEAMNDMGIVHSRYASETETTIHRGCHITKLMAVGWTITEAHDIVNEGVWYDPDELGAWLRAVRIEQFRNKVNIGKGE